MDGTWLFRLDPATRGLAALEPQPRTRGWTRVTVPNVWNLGDDSPPR
jgi:hypothetical protein